MDANEQFLRDAYGNDYVRVLTISFPDDPAIDRPGKWTAESVGSRIKRGAWPLPPDRNNYFCVSLFQGDEHRLESLFDAMGVLAVDDVGTGPTTKVDASLLLHRLGTPTWTWETSPGNEQWLYRLRPRIVDVTRAKALVRWAAGRSNDARDVTRVMRLPAGRNTKTALGPEGFGIKIVLGGDRPGAGVIDVDQIWDAVSQDVETQEHTVLGASSTKRARSVADLMGNDVIGAWLTRFGMVKGLTANGLACEIECPWENDHTTKTSTGAAYFPRTGGFECHHGHCRERTGRDLRMWVEAKLRESGLYEGGTAADQFDKVPDWGGVPQDTEDAEGGSGGNEGRSKNSAELVLERYVYLKTDHRYFDLVTNHVLLPAAFNRAERKRLRAWLKVQDARSLRTRHIEPDTWFAEHGRMADTQTYWPGRDRYFVLDGATHVNRWRPAARPAQGRQVCEFDISPWLDLLEGLVRNEGPTIAERLLDWMALIVGAPGLKPGWHPLIESEVHGLGKDMLILPVRLAVGEENVAALTLNELQTAFNDFIEKRLVVVADVERNSRGTLTQHDVYATIKPYTENTSRMLRVNRKGMQPYSVPNVSGWFLTSNADDALPLSDTDRRFLVVMSTMQKRSDAYYADLREWLDREWPLISEYLHARWQAMAPAQRHALMGNAPATTGKTIMARMGEDRVTVWTREQIEGGHWHDLMSSEDLRNEYERVTRVLSTMVSAQRYAKILRRLGARQLYNGNAVRMKDGRRVNLWAIRCPEQFDLFGEPDLAQAYTKMRIP